MRKVFNRVGDIVANQPNWSSDVMEEFSFLTSVIEARDGTEMRDALRQTPRIELQYTSDQVEQAQQRMFYDLNRFENSGLWIVPVRWRNVRLESEAQVGDISIEINKDVPWWLNEGTTLVLENDDTQEAAVVASIAGRIITLTETLQTGFGAGNFVLLAHSARFQKDNTLTSRTDRHRQVVSRFMVDPGTAPEWPTEIVDPVVHEGYPTFPQKPDWSSNLRTKLNDQRETVDHDRGVIDVTRFRKGSMIDYTMDFTATTQAVADELIGWFTHHMGRRGHFWMPTQMNDLTITTNALTDTKTLVVAGSDFHRAFNDDETLTTVMVKFADGCVQFNRIVSTEFTAGNSVITFHDKWERDVTTDLTISFAFLVRFRDDTLKVRWRSAQAAQMNLAFRPVPNTWVPAPVIHDFRGLPQLYGNNSNDPVAQPSKWLKIDLVAEGVPIAAIDRGECYLRHQQYGESDGLIDGISVYGSVQFHDEDNVKINTSGVGDTFDYGRNSGQDGTETDIAAEYDSGYKLLPPTRIYDPTNEDGTFARPVRYIYIRSSMIYSPVLGGPQNFAYTVEIQAPDWGFYNQDGNIGCP